MNKNTSDKLINESDDSDRLVELYKEEQSVERKIGHGSQ